MDDPGADFEVRDPKVMRSADGHAVLLDFDHKLPETGTLKLGLSFSDALLLLHLLQSNLTDEGTSRRM